MGVTRMGACILKPRAARAGGGGLHKTGCLHVKAAATQVGEKAILVNRAWVEPDVFGDVAIIEVDPAEPYAANALLVDGTVVYPAAYPRTRKRLEKRGLRVR